MLFKEQQVKEDQGDFAPQNRQLAKGCLMSSNPCPASCWMSAEVKLLRHWLSGKCGPFLQGKCMAHDGMTLSAGVSPVALVTWPAPGSKYSGKGKLSD